MTVLRRITKYQSLLAGAALVLLLVCAVAVRIPGVYWLIGYGPQSDYSFHPDDQRFIVSANDFENKFATKRDGYPPFMVTQLFVVSKFLGLLPIHPPSRALILRCISLFNGLLGIILMYCFAVDLGFSLFVSLLASFFLAFAPLYIISSHFGTADITAIVLTYMTIFAAWRYRVSHEEPWLYAAVALAGVAMADKFYLPVLVPPAIILLFPSSKYILSTIFFSMCVFTTFFCSAAFFNFSPWDLKRLIDMIRGDNLVVEGGNRPLQQIVLYAWDMITSSGIITSVFFLIGLSKISYHQLKVHLRVDLFTGNTSRSILDWIRAPSLVIVAPLITNALLICTLQVHAARYALIFIPVVCLIAAIGVEATIRHLQRVPFFIRSAGIAAVLSFLTVQLVDGFLTDVTYSKDIRINLSDFLERNGLTREAQTFISYTHLQGVSHLPWLADRPTSLVFITCDIEYNRYISAGKGVPSYHVFGPKERISFFVSLLQGTADYLPIFHVMRRRESVEDRLAGKGWLPELETFLPNECYAFKRRS